MLNIFHCWVNQLTIESGIIAASRYAKDAASKTTLNDFRNDFRKIAEVRIQELAIVHKVIEKKNEQTVSAWLKYSRPGMFGLFSQHHSSYEGYKMLRKNQPQADQYFIAEKEESAAEINMKLRQSGEEGNFKFKI